MLDLDEIYAFGISYRRLNEIELGDDLTDQEVKDIFMIYLEVVWSGTKSRLVEFILNALHKERSNKRAIHEWARRLL